MRKKQMSEEDKVAIVEIRKNLMTVKDAEPSKLLENPAFYRANKEYILRLMNWLKDSNNSIEKLSYVSINERSFEIFHDEKFLEGHSVQRDQERKLNPLVVKSAQPLLDKCGVSKERLMYYETTEPIAHLIFDYKLRRQKLLIIENEDTYYSMARCFSSPFTIEGETYTGIAYGRGNGVAGSFKNYKKWIPTEKFESVEFGYFGDLDYEGIKIYESIKNNLSDTKVEICVSLYQMMIDKACGIGIKNLPNTKENQFCSDVYLNDFLDNFNEATKNNVNQVLESRKYIPQESVTYVDFRNIRDSKFPMEN